MVSIKKCKLIIFTVLFTVSINSIFPEGDEEIALLYYSGAQDLIQQDNIDGALNLLNISLQFFPAYSDAHYQRGILLLQDQKTTWDGIDALNTALTTDTWIKNDPVNCSLDLADVYCRIDRFQEALETLDKIDSEWVTAVPDFYYLYTCAYEGAGFPEAAKTYLETGRDMFPQNPSLQLLNWKDRVPSFKERDWFTKWESEGSEYLSYLLSYLIRSVDFNIVNYDYIEEMLSQYRNSGGDDPLELVIEYYINDNPKEIIEKLDEKNPNDLYVLRRLYSILESEDDKAILLRIYDDYTGILESDSDRNGYWEEAMRIDSGKVIEIITDENQDGIAERNVHIDELPSKTVIRDGKAVFHYRIYPEAGMLVLTNDNVYGIDVDETIYREYLFKDYAVTYPILHIVPLDTSIDNYLNYNFTDAVPVFTEKNLMESTYQIKEYSVGTDHLIRALELKNGLPIKMVEDSSGDGKWDTIVLFDRGIPLEGMRDPDFDSIFEVTELYTQGNLSMIMYDGNGDGYPEYIENIREKETVLWDFNEDGEIDYKEIRLGRDRILRELYQFSTAIELE
jgi:hypothetical protein